MSDWVKKKCCCFSDVLNWYCRINDADDDIERTRGIILFFKWCSRSPALISTCIRYTLHTYKCFPISFSFTIVSVFYAYKFDVRPIPLNRYQFTHQLSGLLLLLNATHSFVLMRIFASTLIWHFILQFLSIFMDCFVFILIMAMATLFTFIFIWLEKQMVYTDKHCFYNYNNEYNLNEKNENTFLNDDLASKNTIGWQ